MRRITTVAAVGVLALTASGCWPMPGANPDRTGDNPYETAITAATVGDLVEKWATPLTGAQSPVVSPAGLHVPSTGSCDLVTLDRATGSELWRANMGIEATFCASTSSWESRQASAAVSGETVAAGAVKNYGGPRMGIHAASALSVLDIHSGALLAGPHPGEVDTRRDQRLVATDSIVVPFTGTLGYVPRLHLYDLAGTPQRTMVTGANGHATVVGDLAIFAGYGHMLTEPGPVTPAAMGVRAYALDEDRPGCGPMAAPAPYPYVSETNVECPVWVTPIDGSSGYATTPVLAPDGSALFVGTSSGTVYALDPTDGAVLWGSNVGGGGWASAAPALSNGVLYVPTNDGRVVAMDAGGCGAAICAPLWEAATGTGAWIRMQPAVAGGVVFVGADDGSVHGFDATGCTTPPCAPLWSTSTGTALVTGGPIVSQGQLYVTAGGVVRAYGLP